MLLLVCLGARTCEAKFLHGQCDAGRGSRLDYQSSDSLCKEDDELGKMVTHRNATA